MSNSTSSENDNYISSDALAGLPPPPPYDELSSKQIELTKTGSSTSSGPASPSIHGTSLSSAGSPSGLDYLVESGDEDEDSEEESHSKSFNDKRKRRDSNLEKVIDLHRLRVVGEDIKRGNIWKLCYDITCWFWFWLIVTALILSEPVLVSWNPYEYKKVVYISTAVLVASSVCLVIQLAGRAYMLTDDDYVRSERLRSGQVEVDMEVFGSKLADKVWKKLRSLIWSGSFVLELGCLVLGWVFLFYRPGLATLRCFRAFRILWYHDLPPEVLDPLKGTLSILLAPFGGRSFVDLAFKVMKFATQSLSHLGQEMIFLTKKSRGAFILMFLLFYMAYVLGTTLWIETASSVLDNNFCDTLGSCTYTMLRLTFFDGAGFDFAYSLTHQHPILFFCCCVYTCVTSFGIINGLIGVFGDIFKEDSDNVFESRKEKELIIQKKENEHFKRYNNTAESLVLVQLKLEALDRRFERLEKLLMDQRSTDGAAK